MPIRSYHQMRLDRIMRTCDRLTEMFNDNSNGTLRPNRFESFEQYVEFNMLNIETNCDMSEENHIRLYCSLKRLVGRYHGIMTTQGKGNAATFERLLGDLKSCIKG